MYSSFHALATLMPVGLAGLTFAASSTPGQPAASGSVGQFQIIGNSLVSAQQLFLGLNDRVYFVDKVEANPTQINGHAAWASEWSLGSNTQRPMDALTNTFCAGGNVLGNGTWLNVGGNQAVTTGGDPAPSQTGGGVYDDPDGRQSIRMLDPCDDGNCDWVLSPNQIDQRWYPTLETLEDGSIIILGGCRNGGYVNDANQDNPTYEFFPPQGAPIASPILQRTLPVNLYPLTWMLPSGKLLIQSNWETVLLDYHTNTETPLDNIPDAVRTYPASAGTVMLPLTPTNNWTATVLFCGGSNVQSDQWMSPQFIIPTFPASSSCVSITPDVSGKYTHVDPLPEARSMVSFILLPDGNVLGLNGAGLGTAGYGTQSFAIGNSYADDPILKPVLFSPNAPAGQMWSDSGYSASTVPRMYHSSATLLPDGSVLVSGSNPNPDYTVGPGVTYPTEYRTEIFYPAYYNQNRPQPQGLPSTITYGGPSFDLFLSSADLFNNVDNIKNASVVIIRTGFSTHALNMGQRYVQLDSTYTGFQNNTGILHVAQLPPNPAVLVPGPALLFVVVDGVPSVGVMIMVGSGQIGTQQLLSVSDLPTSAIVQQTSASNGTTKPNGSDSKASSAIPLLDYQRGILLTASLLVASLILGS